MPEYTDRLKLPKPLGNETHNRANHIALVEAIEENAASRSEVQTAQQTADAAQAAATAAQTAAHAAQETADGAVSAAQTAQSAAGAAQSAADFAQQTAETAQKAADTAQNTADSAKVAASAAQSTADLAVEAALVVEAALPVEDAEPEQVQTSAGPAIQFAAGEDQAIMFSRYWPFSSALHMELLLSASEVGAGTFAVQIKWQVNGGNATTVARSVTPGANTNLHTVDLGEIIPAASLPAGALITITLTRLGTDDADTHTGAMQIHQCRLKQGE